MTSSQINMFATPFHKNDNTVSTLQVVVVVAVVVVVVVIKANDQKYKIAKPPSKKGLNRFSREKARADTLNMFSLSLSLILPFPCVPLCVQRAQWKHWAVWGGGGPFLHCLLHACIVSTRYGWRWLLPVGVVHREGKAQSAPASLQSLTCSSLSFSNKTHILVFASSPIFLSFLVSRLPPSIQKNKRKENKPKTFRIVASKKNQKLKSVGHLVHLQVGTHFDSCDCRRRWMSPMLNHLIYFYLLIDFFVNFQSRELRN